MTRSLIQRLCDCAETNPDHDALITPSLSISYSQLLELVQAQAIRLLNEGVSDTSVVGIRCADDLRHLVLCLASVYNGATSFTVPTYDSMSAQDALIDRCGATHVIDGNEALDSNSAYSKTSASARVAKLLFSTSGTSGEPKLVVHRDSDLVAQAHRHIGSMQERFACLASIEHNFAKRHRLYCIAAGATNVFPDPSLDSLVSQCQQLAVNVLHVSAFQAQELLAIPNSEQLSEIRLKLGGSHVPLSLRRSLRSRITKKLQAGYGTTETGAIGFTEPDDAQAGESVGQPLPGIEIRAVTAKRVPLGANELGELAIRCDGMFRGYLGDSDLTATRLADGWFYTGDIGYLDSERRIHLCGRADDMFVFNSMNIYPQDVESEIRQFPDIIDAVVLPLPSAVHGHIPVAMVVVADGGNLDFAALRKFMRQRVGARCPRQFTRVAEIPRNATGKIARGETLSLFDKGGETRRHIAESLNSGEGNHLKPASIEAFVSGEKDFTLKDLGLDSLARLDLMVMLEVEYNVVVTPEEFARFRYLSDICAAALSSSSDDKASAKIEHKQFSRGNKNCDLPYVVRFFQRVFDACQTVAQLYKALATLHHRLTPPEVACLHEAYGSGLLIHAEVDAKFHIALNHWFQELIRMMADSGKQTPEPFNARRLAPTATHFIGSGSTTEKTLLICFPGSGDRMLLMPNAVLMQHFDAARYDLLVIAEPLKKEYRLGVPSLGDSLPEVITWIRNLDLLKRYRGVRTLGCSAGGYAATLAAYALNAELGVCVGGRFHSERYPGRILNRVFSTWRAVRNGSCAGVVMTYAADSTRDRNFARVVGRLTGGKLLAIEFTDGDVGHLILRRLVERGELRAFLACTIFADDNAKVRFNERRHHLLTLPSNELQEHS